MELWDAYDSNFRKQEGRRFIRGEKIPEGMFHLVCDVIVRHIDGSYLLMLRDHRKRHGGQWEASAGGSAIAGETPIQCAVRELYEETGITAENIREIGRERNARNRAVYVEFICITDVDKKNIVLQEGETSGYRWVDRDELLSMKDNGLCSVRILKYVEELQD